MSSTSSYWMKHVVGLAAKSPLPGRRVGAALVSHNGELIAAAHEGEEPGASWYEVVSRRLRPGTVSSAHSLYLTMNTLDPGGTFELAKLLREITIASIFVGLPDPRLAQYLDDDPVATHGDVSRFPDDLQREILEQNSTLYARSEQSIDCNPHYSTHRIGEAVFNSLASRGFALTMQEVNANRRRPALASLLCERYEVAYEEADRAVHDALSLAFNAKYGTYDYSVDARSANPQWADDFATVYEKSSAKPLGDATVLNVGVGAGLEAATLFADCGQVTFVDIAERGLKNICEKVPSASTLVASADDLSALPDDTFDVYVSLRTFNSSFFDTLAAAS